MPLKRTQWEEQILTHIKKKNNSIKKFCDSGRTRTFNLLLRRQLLYPVELRNQIMMANVNLLIYYCKRWFYRFSCHLSAVKHTPEDKSILQLLQRFWNFLKKEVPYLDFEFCFLQLMGVCIIHNKPDSSTVYLQISCFRTLSGNFTIVIQVQISLSPNERQKKI